MTSYLASLAELFKQAAMQHDLVATGILAKLLELTTEPAKALAYWNNNRKQVERLADSLTVQEITEYLESVR